MHMLVWVIAGFILLHLFKMIRFYLVLMEHDISLKDFVLLYFRTTLVNLAIPFKIGEAYRVEEVWRMTGIWQVGVLSVVVDRYFDVLSLFLWLLPIGMFLRHSLTPATLIFAAVILAGVVFYAAVPGSFGYLNGFLLKRRASVRSMAALHALNVIREWYDYTARLISGRALLMVVCGALGWGVEILTIGRLAVYLNMKFRLVDFADYIDAVFLGKGNMKIQSSYTGISVVVFAVLTVLGYAVYLATLRSGSKGKDS